MINLFKQEKPRKCIHRVCRVENLNPDKGILSYMLESKDMKEYHTCLCLPGRHVSTKFNKKSAALEQLEKYRALYLKKGV